MPTTPCELCTIPQAKFEFDPSGIEQCSIMNTVCYRGICHEMPTSSGPHFLHMHIAVRLTKAHMEGKAPFVICKACRVRLRLSGDLPSPRQE